MGELGHHVKLNHSDTERQKIIVALIKYNLKKTLNLYREQVEGWLAGTKSGDLTGTWEMLT